MVSPDFKSSSKVDSWVASTKAYKPLGTKGLVAVGKEASTSFRRAWLSFLHIFTLTIYKPTKFYASRGESVLLAYNLTHLKSELINEKIQGRDLSAAKVAKIVAKVSQHMAFMQSSGVISTKYAMRYQDHRDRINAACLRSDFASDSAPWMAAVGFDYQNREKAPLSLLRLMNALRKENCGQAFADWLALNPVLGETLEVSVDRFLDHKLSGMGVALEVYYRDKLSACEDRSALMREILMLEPRFIRLGNTFQNLGLTNGYVAHLSQKLQSGSLPADLAESMHNFRISLAGVLERYSRLDNNAESSVEDQFKVFLQARPDAFSEGSLERIQQDFNIQQQGSGRLGGTDDNLRRAIEVETESGKHFLETDAGKARNLLDQISSGPLSIYVKSLETLSAQEILDVLVPVHNMKKLFKKYGQLKAYNKAAEKIVSNKSLKSMAIQEKLQFFVSSHADIIASLRQLDDIQKQDFEEKGPQTVFVKAVTSAISTKMNSDNSTLRDALESVADRIVDLLGDGDEEAKMELLCEFLVQELNQLADKKDLFDVDFVKKYLMEGELEARMGKLSAWARFSKGRNRTQLLNFIRDFDEPLMTHYKSKQSVKSDGRKAYGAMVDLYSTYSSRNANGQASALIAAFKGSEAYEAALSESNIKSFEKNIAALREIISFAHTLTAKGVYDADLIAEGMFNLLEAHPTVYEFAKAIDKKAGKEALNKTFFNLYVRRQANLGLGKQGSDLFIEQLTAQFKGTESFPKSDQLRQVKLIAANAGNWYLGGSRRLDVMTQLVAAKERHTICFKLSDMKESKYHTLKEISLPAIEENLERLKEVGIAARRTSSFHTIFDIANNKPEKLITAILPAFIEPLIQNDSDKSKVRDLKRRLGELEPKVSNLDAVKDLGQLFIRYRDAVTIISMLPPEESARLAQEVLGSLSGYATSKKNGVEPPKTENAIGLVSTQILQAAVSAIVEKVSEARDTNVSKLPFPAKQAFYDSFPDVKAVTEHWGYKYGMRFAPKFLSLVGRSGAVGETLMKVPLTFLVKILAKDMPSAEQNALINSLGPVIEVLSLAASSFLQRHQIDVYFKFLNDTNDFMRKDSVSTPEEIALFEQQIWSFMHNLFNDLGDYPTAVEQVLRAISDLASPQRSE